MAASERDREIRPLSPGWEKTRALINFLFILSSITRFEDRIYMLSILCAGCCCSSRELVENRARRRGHYTMPKYTHVSAHSAQLLEPSFSRKDCAILVIFRKRGERGRIKKNDFRVSLPLSRQLAAKLSPRSRPSSLRNGSREPFFPPSRCCAVSCAFFYVRGNRCVAAFFFSSLFDEDGRKRSCI